MDVIQFNCITCCITSIIQHESFLSKIFQKLWRGKYFFNVTSDSLIKNSAIQLKSNKAIKLKYFNVLDVWVIS